ncbi:MAG: MBL fold metallo-hydrolase [Anaerolineales bacterium]|nr:MBL fold metallo-hydrolase [Anaerolineales bacterium]
MLPAPHPADRLHPLPGQAIHLGHSAVLLNIAGLRVLLDPATLDGLATAPFANLAAPTQTRLTSYRPLVDFSEIVPSAPALARSADVVLYSHLHADHFSATVLQTLMAHNPDLRVILPHGATRLLRAPRPAPGRALERGLKALSSAGWLDTTPDGLREYLRLPAPDLPWARTFEVADGGAVVLRDMPRVVLRAFAVRHPRPLMWVPTPFEAAYPLVLGFEIGYDDRGRWRQVLLVGETALDAGVLQRLLHNAATLSAAFLPVDLPLGGPLLETWYAHDCHAPPAFLAMAARLAGPRSTIVPIHQGLWCYDFQPSDVPDLNRQRRGPTPLAQTVEDALVSAGAHSAFGPLRLHAWRHLTDVVAALPPQAVLADPTPGRPFGFDHGASSSPVWAQPRPGSVSRQPLNAPFPAGLD